MSWTQAIPQSSQATTVSVPRFIKVNGTVKDPAVTGITGITFALYPEREGGAALFIETQNVTLDASGHYTAFLGITKLQGLPMDIFTSGEARWLGIQPAGQPEQPRILLLSVPYALKAADAETLGGKPASAFLLAAPPPVSTATSAASAPPKSRASLVTALSPTPCATPVIDSNAATNSVALFTANCTIGSSVLMQNNSTTIQFPATGTATSSGGFNSNALDFQASSYNSGLPGAVSQDFLWQAKPVGNNTASPSGKLSLLFGAAGAAPTETGLSIASGGILTFASGQTFPGAGTGNGTVTTINTGTGLTGGPINTSGTLNIDPTVVPQLGAGSNTFTGTITANSFSGNGASLTNINPANISAGSAGINITGNAATATTATTASNATQLGGVVATNYARLDQGNSFNGNQTVTGNVTATGSMGGSSANLTGALAGTTANFSGVVTHAGAVLPAKGAATSGSPFSSNPLDLFASSFNGSALNEQFRLQAEGNGSSDTGTLNLLAATGSKTLAETGLSIASNGVITFAGAQTFPGAGSGTVTSVGTGAGLTGGPITSSGSLSIAPAGVSNAMLANPAVTVNAGTDLTGGGSVALGSNVTLNLDTTKVPQLGAVSNIFTGAITANSFSGSGASLTSLNPANIGAGTAGISITGNASTATTASNAQQLNGQPASFYASTAANSFNGNQTVTGNISATGSLAGGSASLTGALTGTTANFSGVLSSAGQTLPAVGAATAGGGFNSNPLDTHASSFNSGTSAALDEVFRLQAEPVGNNTASPSGKLNLLFGAGGTSPAETGLSIGNNGIINFASGQTFPGTGGGTVTSVASGTGLTGGPITGSGTLSIAPAGVSNAMLANSSITVQAGPGLSGGGVVALGGTVSISNSAPSLGGTVTSVGSGTGLTGGPVTGAGTLSLDTTFTDARYLQLGGGTLTGALAGTSANFSRALTTSGAILPATGTATATAGFSSNVLDTHASSFNSTSAKAIDQLFRLQAEPAGNNTSNPSGKLNLLFGTNGTAPTETGLSMSSQGVLTFAPGQTFPIATGGVTNTMLQNPSLTIQPGTGLSGGGAVNLGGTDTLSLNTGFTDARYLQLLGGTLTGALSGTTATFTNGLTSAGASLPPLGAATFSSGSNSNPLDLHAASLNGASNTSVDQLFRWQAEPVGNDGVTPSGKLNLLFGTGGATPTETGISISTLGTLSTGGVVMFPSGTATAAQGFNSTGLDLVASTFNTVANSAGKYVYRWQAEPLNNDAASSTATLNLLYGVQTNDTTVSETGLSINKRGIVTFAPGQTFPGAGGTITGVTAGTDLTGGGTSGSVTLNLNTSATDARYAQLGGANTFAGNQSVTGNLSATGAITGASASFGTLGATGTISGHTGTFTGAVSAAGSILPALATATSTRGFNSNPMDTHASSFNSGTSAAVDEEFRLQAETKGNNSANPSATLNVLFGTGGTPTETGLSIASNGVLTFAPGQTFPGSGSGTVTTINTGSGLSGGPITTSGTLSVNPTVVPLLGASSNSFAGAISASSFSGNGASLTSLNPANLSSGNAAINITGNAGTATTAASATTASNAQALNGQPASFYATTGANSFSGNQSVTGNISATGALSGGSANLTGGLTGKTATFSGGLSSAGHTLPATGSATATAGFNSNPLDTHASSFNSGTSAAVDELFRLQAEPVGSNTTAPSSKLHLLFGAAGASPAETGLSIGSNGIITFASGQTFPGSGGGTITGITAGTDLTGGGTSGTVTLNLNTTSTDARYARLGAANTFTGNQGVTGNVSATGSISGASLTTTGLISGNTASFTGALSARGAVLPATGTATATLGFNSNPLDSHASSFNSGTAAAVDQLFRWQAEPVGSDTTSPSARLNLLFGAGGVAPVETGLSISNNGTVTGKQLVSTGDVSLAERPAPSGVAAQDLMWGDSGDHMLHQNLNNGGNQQVPITAMTTSTFTNATTTFSTVTNMSFTVAASRNYTLSCEILFQGSATTAGPKFQLTGPALPRAVMLDVDGGTNAAAYANAGATAFSSAVAALGTLGIAARNFVAHVSAGIANGANSGTVALQAAANGTGTLTIQPGSWCRFQ
jgi:hypothetical protein